MSTMLDSYCQQIRIVSQYLNLPLSTTHSGQPQICQKQTEVAAQKKKRQADKNITANILSAILNILQSEEKTIFKRYQQIYQSKCDKMVIAHLYLFCIQRMKSKKQMNQISRSLLNKIQKMRYKLRLNPQNFRAIQRIQINIKILNHLFFEDHGNEWKQMMDNFCLKRLKTICEGLTENTQKNQVLTSLKKLRTRQKLVKLVRARLLPNINRSIRVLTQNQDNTPGH